MENKVIFCFFRGNETKNTFSGMIPLFLGSVLPFQVSFSPLSSLILLNYSQQRNCLGQGGQVASISCASLIYWQLRPKVQHERHSGDSCSLLHFLHLLAPLVHWGGQVGTQEWIPYNILPYDLKKSSLANPFL